jgi:3-O-methylgallate 3,4-dioxygenase
LDYVSPEIKGKYTGPEPFAGWAARCQRALDELSFTLRSAKPDITVIISDDQDEWFYEGNMPALSVYWGETAPVIPRHGPWTNKAVAEAIAHGYGDVEMDVPVAGRFGRFLIEYLMEHDFDVGQMNYTDEQYAGRVGRRYPTRDGGELDHVRTTQAHRQGLPHGFSFIIKRLFCNEPSAILPVLQNTCYPPNQVTPKRCFAVGEAIAAAVAEWPEPARVAVIASGGLSHFVVDEELDNAVLGGLERKDPQALKSIPRKKLYSAASESMNWIALGGAMQELPLKMELVDYVPVYRTPAGTGGGWAFARWQ